MLDRLTMATRGPSSLGIYIHVIAVDAGFGCVELVVAGDKERYLLYCAYFIFKMRTHFFPRKNLKVP